MTDRDLFVEFAPGSGPFDVIPTAYMESVLGTGNATTPDTAALDITGDIDLRGEVEITPDWVLGGSSVVGKWNGTGDQRSYLMFVSNNCLILAWSPDGTLGNAIIAGGAPGTVLPWSSGRHAVRATLDVNNGLGGWTATWYVSDTMDGPWTQLTQEVNTSATTSIFSGTAVLTAGNGEGGTLTGKIYRVQVRSGIDGTVVANPDFTEQADGTTSFADSTGKTWTLNGDADLVAHTWVDLSSRLLSADWSYGRDDELEDFPAGEATIVLKNDDRLLDPDYAAGTYFGELLPRVPFRLTSSTVSLNLPGTAGAYASTPDTASYNVTDVDLRVKFNMNDWTPGGFGVFIAGQYPNVGGNNGWVAGMSATGFPNVTYTTDGTTAATRTSTAATGFSDGTANWLRWVFDSNNGAAGHTVTFYTSEDDGVSWTTLSTVTTAGTVTLFNSTASFDVGNILSWAGRVYRVQLLDGIDGSTVIDVDFTKQAIGNTSFSDDDGRVWTLNSTSSIDFDNTYTERLDQFYGFVEEGWQQDLQPPEYANCTVSLVDKLGVLGGYQLPDVMDFQVLALEPVGYWVLDGPSGTEQVSDLSGNGNDGTVESVNGITFGSQPIASGHGSSALFTTERSITAGAEPEKYARVFMGNSPVIDPTGTNVASVVATFISASTAMLNFRPIYVQDNGSGDFMSLTVSDAGTVDYGYLLNGGGNSYRWPTPVQDGLGHIAFGSASGVAVDSTTLSTSSVGFAWANKNGVSISGLPGYYSVDHFDGNIGSVAVYDRNISVNERFGLLEAFNRLSGDRSDQHVSWALDRLGVEEEHRNLSEGSVYMGSAQTRNQDALEWIRAVTHTEGGAFYVDHRDGGKLRFTDRYLRFTSSRSTTAQISFSDDPALSFFDAVRVEREGLEIAPNGISGIVNQVAVSWRDGEEIVSDDASIVRYGPRTRQLSTEGTTAAAARSAGEWVVARYKDPRSRVRRVMINPGAAVTGFRAVFNLRIDDRVTYRMHPQQVGSAISMDLFVDGVTHSVNEGLVWTTEYRLAPVDTFTPWIWGVSEWDTETYWG